jgi:phosphoenolpyruvate carboxykinase (GTP)
MEKKFITQFPEERMIWSYGSGYGGNALLGKKCFALRIASAIAKDEGWLAEHMLILKLTSPKNEVKYITGAFPSACGKTNLAMINPSLKNWKAETIGDDIAWLKIKEDGLMYAINPEAGFFGVTSGTCYKTNPTAMNSIKSDTIFTNVALTDDFDVYWEGLSQEPDHLIDWHGNDWYKGDENRPDHPNARFTASLTNCPSLADEYEKPVPISAILFGGRRPSTIPLIHQSFNFKHGIFIGSIMGSEITAAAIDENIGKVRRDPFAMLPFIGYNIADYINHWLDVSKQTTEEKLPKIFFVNWFRKENGKFLWPGFGENSRVLKWIFERTDDENNYVESAIGLLPDTNKFDFNGLNIDKKNIDILFGIDKGEWLEETEAIRKYYYSLYQENTPLVLREQLSDLIVRLEK